MAHEHNKFDNDPYFVIDPVTRVITNKSDTKKKLMQYDHNSERFTFEIPRFVDGHDMSACDKIKIHYLNVNSSTKETSADVYFVDDVQISPDDEEKVVFSWLISRSATMHAGTLNFLVRFVCVNGDTIEYAWGTDIYKGITIADGINNSAAVLEEYSDVLAAWASKIDDIHTIEVIHLNTLNVDTFKRASKKFLEGKTMIVLLTAKNEAVIVDKVNYNECPDAEFGIDYSSWSGTYIANVAADDPEPNPRIHFLEVQANQWGNFAVYQKVYPMTHNLYLHRMEAKGDQMVGGFSFLSFKNEPITDEASLLIYRDEINNGVIINHWMRDMDGTGSWVKFVGLTISEDDVITTWYIDQLLQEPSTYGMPLLDAFTHSVVKVNDGSF